MEGGRIPQIQGRIPLLGVLISLIAHLGNAQSLLHPLKTTSFINMGLDFWGVLVGFPRLLLLGLGILHCLPVLVALFLPYLTSRCMGFLMLLLLCMVLVVGIIIITTIIIPTTTIIILMGMLIRIMKETILMSTIDTQVGSRIIILRCCFSSLVHW